MAGNDQQTVAYSEALSALTSLGYCGDIAFLSSIVGEAKPSFKKRVESAMMLAMEVGVSQGWSSCTDRDFVWTGHEPIRRVLEVKCSDFCKEHAREILGEYYGSDGKRTYLQAIPGIPSELEAERAKRLPNLGKYREALSLYLKESNNEMQKKIAKAKIYEPAPQQRPANKARRKMHTR